jgi:formylglycine-generating enzyme required for sulfatase activity
MTTRRPRPAPAALLLAGILAAVGCQPAAPSASSTPSGPVTTVAPSLEPSPVVPTPSPPRPKPTIEIPPPRNAPGESAGEVRTDARGIEQVWVPAGTFTMGTSAEEIAALEAAGPPAWLSGAFATEQPAHEVTITDGFWIDRYEVTNAAFDAFVDAGGYASEALWSDDGWAWLGSRDVSRLPLHCQGDVPEHPRMCLTWFEAEAYATWRGGRLPTEAEWEFAARGPESPAYPWGDTFDIERANVVNSVAPKPVGSYPAGASWVGALDMAGNAMEWVADWLDPAYYASSPAEDPPGPASGTVKVEKGGWWGSNEFVARAAYRHFEDPPTYGDKHIGFRVVSR